jgi:hypothetical protein
MTEVPVTPQAQSATASVEQVTVGIGDVIAVSWVADEGLVAGQTIKVLAINDGTTPIISGEQW